jgi:hypothetical protein
MTNKEESNEKWNSFAESALLSLKSPVAPRRSGNAVRLPSLGMLLDEEDSFNFGSNGSHRISRSLSPCSTSNREVKKDLDSSRTTKTSPTSFSTFGLTSPYSEPPKPPARKISGDGLVRRAEVSDEEKKRSSVSNNSSEEEYEEEEDFFLDLNDNKSSKEGGSIRRFRRAGALLRAFSDSELSEASTINSCGENQKDAARKQKLKDIQEARIGKRQIGKDKRRRKELEEDDLVDTDMDVAKFTGLAKLRSKSMDDMPLLETLALLETLVSRVGKSSPRSTARSRKKPLEKTSNHSKGSPRSTARSRKGPLEKTSNHSKGSHGSRTPPNSRRSRKGTSVGSRTKNRSNRRLTSSDEDSSSAEEKDDLTNGRTRSSDKSPRRRRKSSKGMRKGRRPPPQPSPPPPPPPPAEVRDERPLNVPKRLIIDLTQPDIISPCTVASRSVRDALSVASASASKMGSIRSNLTSSSRLSRLSLTTGCSSVSSGAFDDDFSKQSNETIKSERQSPTSERRFPIGSLATLQESSMKSFTSLEKTQSSRAENEGDLNDSKSSRFMPHKPQRLRSGDFDPRMFSPKSKSPLYAPLSDNSDDSDGEESSVEEKSNIPMTSPTSDPMKEVKGPTHVFRKEPSDRFVSSLGRSTPKPSKSGRRKPLLDA